MKNLHDESKLKNEELLGLLVHSYNNHLAAMMGYTELALLDHCDDLLKERLDLILASGTDAVALGKNILAAIGRLQIPTTTVDLIPLFGELEKNSRVKLNIGSAIPELSQINTNPAWFIDCMQDLLDFVIEYSNASTVFIELSKLKKHQYFTVKIASNGIELTKDETSQLFEPFYSSRQLQGTKELGLAKTKGFFGQMRTTLEWRNDIGFVLQLPLCSGN